MKKRDTFTTFLGKNTEFVGKLTFNGTIRVDGHLKGEILTDGTIIVGQGGMIEANIHASALVISGEIYGDIIADQRIDIHAPGKVLGNIQAPILVIDEGATFEGNCHMYQEEVEDKKWAVRVDQFSDKDNGKLPIVKDS